MDLTTFIKNPTQPPILTQTVVSKPISANRQPTCSERGCKFLRWLVSSNQPATKVTYQAQQPSLEQARNEITTDTPVEKPTPGTRYTQSRPAQGSRQQKPGCIDSCGTHSKQKLATLVEPRPRFLLATYFYQDPSLKDWSENQGMRTRKRPLLRNRY